MGLRRRVRERAPAWVVLVAALTVVASLITGCSASAGTETAPSTVTGQYTGTDTESGLAWIARSELPPEAVDTLDEISAGPPYRYDRDGVTFENREGLLPEQEAGYYQEFTVVTPGSSDRGARRIIWGLQDELYYTDDHYQSFERIAP